MKYAKKYLRRLKEDLRELLGLLSIEELTQNKEIAKRFQIAEQQLVRWS